MQDHLAALKLVIDKYLDLIINTQREKIEIASDLCAQSLLNNGLIYVFGAGHSMMMALEMFYRAGGLAGIYPIIDPDLLGFNGSSVSGFLEHVSGFAKALLDSINLVPNSTLIVVSRSGINNAPVEMAFEAKQRGLKVIAITSIKYSQSLRPNNTLGKRLYEIADVAIDDGVPEGEVAYEVDGYKVAAISTILDSFIIHSIEILTISKLLARGIKPSIWISTHIPGARENNEKLREKYKSLIKYL